VLNNTWIIRLGKVGLALAALGALDALYLTYLKLAEARAAFCQAGTGCDVVNSSPYSEIAGVPVAVLGLGAYLSILGLGVLRWKAPGVAGLAELALLAITLTGTLFSGYLTYIELFVLKAVCPYCVLSAVILLALLGICVARMKLAPAS